jgi:uncharacterized membrane protein YphA (DoxX/SURF4 family)
MTTSRTGGPLTWTIQILLALLFLFAGVSKFTMPDEELTKATPALSAAFFHFIGICELLGGLGLVLPMLLNIRPGLTPLAAAGLVIIMIGATITTAIAVSMPMALIPLVVGLLAAYVAYRRWPLLRRGSASGRQFV